MNNTVKNDVAVVRPENPIDIAPEKVKAFAMLHRCSPQDAFGCLLAKDLLERLAEAQTVEDIKAVVKVLVTSVVGDGKPPERVKI